MDREQILAILTPLIIKRGEDVTPEDVTEGAVIEDLGIDSVGLGALISDAEAELDFQVPEDARNNGEPPKTVGDLVDRVELRLQEKAQAAA